MMKKITAVLFLLFVTTIVIVSCKNKEPSIVKIFVRNANNQLISDARVIIIADVNSEPATPAYVDTVLTNNGGFASFNLQPLFDTYSKDDDKLAFFDIIVKFDGKQANGEIRSRAHVTAVETIILLE